MTAPFSNDTHRFFVHTKISNEDEVLLSEYIKDFPYGYWRKNIITPPINNLNYVIILDGKNRRKKIITKRVV